VKVTAPPRLPHIQSALRRATEYFAAELLQPTSHAPSWSDLEWSMARAAAVLHGVAPLLAGVLRWQGPREWERFLSQQRSHTALRQQRIAALLARIDDSAQRANVAIVPLKGAALYRLGLYSGGERPMADVDLLVAEGDAQSAQQLLHGLGYLDTLVCWKHREFEPTQAAVAVVRKAVASFGEHADRPIKIDLHTRICERLPLNTADISELMFPPAPHAGLNHYPSAAALFMHLLLHASGNMMMRTLRLIQLHDLALLAGRMNPDDWVQLLARRGSAMALWWAVPPLELLTRYYPQAVPADVLAAFRPDCPRRLRAASRRQTISDVSLTALRIEAFPGIAWSGSMSEKLSYMIARVLPSRELRQNRAVVRSQEAWALDDSWSEMSQGKRMLTWVFGHPPRPPAMYVVRRALEDPASHAAPAPLRADENRGAARMP
jgi:Uncharacterised nucleotidyltransferase